MLWGAIIGDIVGSVYEFANIKTKDFPLFREGSYFTDDTVMTVAIAQAILNSRKNNTALADEAIKSMQSLGRAYPDRGYGGAFAVWLLEDNPAPYNSWGNGAAMRVSACGWAGNTLEQVKRLSHDVTAVTHNHPEGIKGAEATAVAIFMARTGHQISEIKKYICDNYYFIDFDMDDIRDWYDFDVSCQGTVPQALQAFFESTSFEDAIRNAISIGGDSDTIGAITGAVAEAYYGIPNDILVRGKRILTYELGEIVKEFNDAIQDKK